MNDLAIEMQSCLEQPFAFFGHSMGTLISFDLARAVRDRYNTTY
jgi:medium-chain acyl-[acyl-carrier-protein] hydrolase